MVGIDYFNTSGEGRQRTSHNDKGVLIARILHKGGPFRQFLHELDIHPDTESWRGRPGAVVALEVLQAVKDVPVNPNTANQQMYARAAEQTEQTLRSLAGIALVTGQE